MTLAFGRLGPLLAEPGIPADAFVRALEGRVALALAPSNERGWLGGTAIVAWDPVELCEGVDLRDAGELLEAAFECEGTTLAAALVTYEGEAAVAWFGGALVLAEDGWHSWGELRDDAAAVIERARDLSEQPGAPASEPLLAEVRWDLSGREYRAGVETVRERIAAGDVFVLNLTARLFGRPALPVAEAFSALLMRAGSEMNAWLGGLCGLGAHGTSWIASVSPERFLRVRKDYGVRIAEVCPIKGTRPRGTCAETDEALASALLDDVKERAEHVMVVDMERNDLGRVCMPGTVRVDPLYEVVPTPYCHQLVSTVRGTLAEKASIADLLEATFPCGSVTGAPKVAAMAIAAELEPTPRGAYCGGLFVAVPGTIDSSVLIRTLEGRAAADSVTVVGGKAPVAPDVDAAWGTGCGITYDSDPVSEHLEMLLKASPVTGDVLPPVALRETMRIAFGRAPLLDRHLTRLALGGCGPTLLARVREAVAEQLRQLDPAAPYSRIGVTIGSDGSVAALATLEPSSLDVEGGPVLVPVEVAELPSLPPMAAKPASRRYWDRAHATARMRGGHQAVLTSGEVLVDGSTATVWLVLDGVLATPPAPPAVAGVMRELVFDIASSLGIPAEERRLTTSDLDAASEVFLGNGVGGVVAVRGRGGAICERIAQVVEAAFTL